MASFHHKLQHRALLAASLLLAAPCAEASDLIEYHMHMEPAADGAKRVAVTLDACMGKVDDRILSTLIDNKIRATIFVTGRWLKKNAEAIATLKAHPELFEIENHGAKHLAAVDEPVVIYDQAAAGSPEAVAEEVSGGAKAVEKAFGGKPTWYRGATAEYTQSSMDQIKALGFKVAGFTFSGDGGALFSADHAARVIAKTKDGDVILAHINQPSKAAGEGVAAGLLKLKDEGFTFVTLNEGFDKPL